MSDKISTWPASSDKLCWNCCHPFLNVPAFLPIHTKGRDFEFYGNFCSWNCVKAYSQGLRTYRDNSYIALFAFLTVYRPRNCPTPDQTHHSTSCPCLESYVPLRPALPRQCLQIFGGTLSIVEYRDGFSFIASPPARRFSAYHSTLSQIQSKDYLFTVVSDPLSLNRKLGPKWQQVVVESSKKTEQGGEEYNSRPVVHYPVKKTNILQALVQRL